MSFFSPYYDDAHRDQLHDAEDEESNPYDLSPEDEYDGEEGFDGEDQDECPGTAAEEEARILAEQLAEHRRATTTLLDGFAPFDENAMLADREDEESPFDEEFLPYDLSPEDEYDGEEASDDGEDMMAAYRQTPEESSDDEAATLDGRERADVQGGLLLDAETEELISFFGGTTTAQNDPVRAFGGATMAPTDPVRGESALPPVLSGLVLACANGAVDEARSLLDGGAAVDGTDVDPFSPLWAACRAGHVIAATLCLDRGADVNRNRESGDTPLHAACFMGHVHLPSGDPLILAFARFFERMPRRCKNGRRRSSSRRTRSTPAGHRSGAVP